MIMELWRKVKDSYIKHKKKIIFGFVLILILSVGLQLFLFFNERMNDSDIRFDYIGWTWTCAGKNYTVAERDEFCTSCLNSKDFACEWPLDMNLTIKGVNGVRLTGGEVHCFFIIDGLNYYAEMGRFYGLTNETLFTWQVLRADANHTVEYCCGIDRPSPITTIFGLEKDIHQACAKENVAPRCGPEYKIENTEAII